MRKAVGILLLSFIAFTLMADVKIFKGNSTYTRDCVVTYKDGKLYRGNSTYTRDCMLTFSGPPSEALIAWLIFSFYRGMLW